jgi:hypothetical protein
MTINNPELFMAGVWDWAILDGCFGNTRIRPTDIDGCVERNGHFLYFETKRPGAHIPFGQLLTYRGWVNKGDSVIVIWGEKNKPQRLQVFTPRHRPPDGKVYAYADVTKLRQLVGQWFDLVDRNVFTPVARK